MVGIGPIQMQNLPVPPPIWIILIPIILLGALTVLLLIFARGKRPPDDAWKGMFYSNREDPAVFVPKRYGFGYTLNFGNPWSWVVLVLILGAVVTPLLLSVNLMHQLPK
jgi:uncharacterized membrane protein